MSRESEALIDKLFDICKDEDVIDTVDACFAIMTGALARLDRERRENLLDLLADGAVRHAIETTWREHGMVVDDDGPDTRVLN